MSSLMLERFSYAPTGTFGRLTLPSGKQLYTVEQPWNSNKRSASCIPDGVYSLEKRRSPVVERTSGGGFSEGWEALRVPGRSLIMIHPGNWPRNFEGCIGVGVDYRVMEGASGVTQSRLAFKQLMTELADRSSWVIDIRPFIMEYP